MNFIFSSNSSVRRSRHNISLFRSSIVLSTEVKLVLIEKGNMENETTDMIVKNVKIDKTIFLETYTCEKWL